ncbi:Hypothetical protein CINCED_3A017596 [Cinara cedri]|uniref:Uncharacterized protein n=1 Tax=Cinara cedri TaxID=506608 RepID=A0A5E4N4M2_9HEMI|nr:Hypothetical protein CINCED_3A017596 [Cinara cedri]
MAILVSVPSTVYRPRLHGTFYVMDVTDHVEVKHEIYTHDPLHYSPFGTRNGFNLTRMVDKKSTRTSKFRPKRSATLFTIFKKSYQNITVYREHFYDETARNLATQKSDTKYVRTSAIRSKRSAALFTIFRNPIKTSLTMANHHSDVEIVRGCCNLTVRKLVDMNSTHIRNFIQNDVMHMILRVQVKE